MTALLTNNDQGSLISRRSIFIRAAAALICAPAIVRITNLMPVRRLPFPHGPQYAGFVDRLLLDRKQPEGMPARRPDYRRGR
jgi:hypothetical protein